MGFLYAPTIHTSSSSCCVLFSSEAVHAQSTTFLIVTLIASSNGQRNAQSHREGSPSPLPVYSSSSKSFFCLALFSTFNRHAFIIGLSVVPLIMVYPLLKRITSWPQAWLGVAANTGLPLAWAAVQNSIDYKVVVPLMTSAWCWTMLYDTIYACQDKRDDAKAGVRSTALLFGSWTRGYLIGIGMSFVAMFAYAGFANDQGIAYFALSVIGTAVHIAWQLWTVDLDDPASCGANFHHNSQLGYLIWSGMMVDYLSRAASV